MSPWPRRGAHRRVSGDIGWLDGDRRFPGEYRFPRIATLASVEARVHEKGATRVQRRFCIASRKMAAADSARALGHWAIENSLHWVLDVVFREDSARSRTGHGPANMAVVRHFAFNLLRAVDDKRSIDQTKKGRTKHAIPSPKSSTPRRVNPILEP